MIKSKAWCLEDFYFSEEHDEVVKKYFSEYNIYNPNNKNSSGVLMKSIRTVFFMEEISLQSPLPPILLNNMHRHLDIFFTSSQPIAEIESIFPSHRIAHISVKNTLALHFSPRWTEPRKRTILEKFEFL